MDEAYAVMVRRDQESSSTREWYDPAQICHPHVEGAGPNLFLVAPDSGGATFNRNGSILYLRIDVKIIGEAGNEGILGFRRAWREIGERWGQYRLFARIVGLRRLRIGFRGGSGARIGEAERRNQGGYHQGSTD